MARFICKCNEVLLNLPGGLLVDIDGDLGSSQLVCGSCGETAWTFEAGMRFVDGGVTYSEAGEHTYEPDSDEHRIECECGHAVVLSRPQIDFAVTTSDRVTEEAHVDCCGCKDVFLRVPAGYLLRLKTSGKTIVTWPALRRIRDEVSE